MKKTAYIAGKINGLPAQQAARHFARKEQELQEKGYDIINPYAAIASKNDMRKAMGEPLLTDEHNRREILAECIYNLLKYADELHMLPGWQQSKGASLERDIAIRLGIPVVYHKI